MLIILSGCSGVGKNTIINRLLQDSDRFEFMPTFTTRAMREGEREGFPYYYTTKEDFERRIAAGEFYEYENVHGNYYGTNKKVLEEKKKTGKILIKDIDVLGTLNLEKKMSSDIKIVTVFLDVESKQVLIDRLIGRGEKDIELRMKRYELEVSHAKEYQYIVNNIEIERTISIINAIVDHELSNEEFVCGSTDDVTNVKPDDGMVELEPVNGKLVLKNCSAQNMLNKGQHIAKLIR